MLERCELRLLLRHGIGLLHCRLQRLLLGRIEHRHVARQLLEVRGDQRARLQQATSSLHQTMTLRVDLVGPCDLRRALALGGIQALARVGHERGALAQLFHHALGLQLELALRGGPLGEELLFTQLQHPTPLSALVQLACQSHALGEHRLCHVVVVAVLLLALMIDPSHFARKAVEREVHGCRSDGKQRHERQWTHCVSGSDTRDERNGCLPVGEVN